MFDGIAVSPSPQFLITPVKEQRYDCLKHFCPERTPNPLEYLRFLFTRQGCAAYSISIMQGAPCRLVAQLSGAQTLQGTPALAPLFL